MMLQQILEARYIEPELLEELSDEQKHVLFCKIREEQVRCWFENERALQSEGAEEKKKQSTSSRHIQFLEGKDGKEWVWVMGEHQDDRSVEEILEVEAQELARKQAEKEAEEQQQREERELQQRLLEEQEKIEQERLRREEELRRQEEEAEIYQTLKEARLAAELLEKERQQKEQEEKLRMQQLRDKEQVWRRSSQQRKKDLIKRRSGEIYSSFKSIRSKFEAMALADQQNLEKSWQKQEESAKAAESELRAIARRAREEHKRSIRATTTALSAINAFSAAGTTGRARRNAPAPTSPSPRDRLPERPANRQAVIEWFQREELPKGAGLDPATRHVASWFHGLISRQVAERLLEKGMVGAFLVRVSERIWGYAISYRGSERCKHFLIDAAAGHYQFLGTSHPPHPSLHAFITHYRDHPISIYGQEFLLHPCHQEDGTPDWSDLLQYHDAACDTAL